MKLKLKVFIVKAFKVYKSLIWYFSHKELIKSAFRNESLDKIRPFKILTWRNGAFYFLASKCNEEVFIKLNSNHNLIEREARILKILNKNSLNEFFPTLISYSKESDDFSFLAINFIAGLGFGNFEITKKNQAISVSEQFVSISNILRQESIVHRDVKPDNILVTYPESNTMKITLIDFGQAVFTGNKNKEIPPIQFGEKNSNQNLGEEYRYRTNIWDDVYSMYKILKDKKSIQKYTSACQSNLNLLKSGIGVNTYEYKANEAIN